MRLEPTILDTQVHEFLKVSGYKFLLITDIQFNENKISSVTVKAEKEIPHSMTHSCTGIDDPMITTFIYSAGLNCQIFIEPFEEIIHIATT